MFVAPGPCHVARKVNSEEMKRYIAQKRLQQKKDLKAREEKEKARNEAIKTRLIELEIKRKKVMSKV